MPFLGKSGLRVSDVALATLVLAYMLKLPGMGPVIPSASSIVQLKVNAAAGTLGLAEEQCTTIAEILNNESKIPPTCLNITSKNGQ